MSASTCPRCGDRLLWGHTARGAPVPLNRERNELGPLAIREQAGRVTVRYLRANAMGCTMGEWRGISHLDTCPKGVTHAELGLKGRENKAIVTADRGRITHR